MKARWKLKIIVGLIFSSIAWAESPPPAMYYRDFTLRVRQSSNFRVPMPSGGDMAFSYELKFGDVKFTEPLLNDFFLDANSDKFFRNFWDKVYLKDGSYISLGGEQIPLTCIFISGQDNRFTKKDSPLLPDYVFKVYLVANDFTCTGPINPGWPANGGKKETWETYVYFEVRDPTIMLPMDAHIRYRWTEFPAVLNDQGGDQ